MKKIIYIGQQWDKNLAYFRYEGSKNRMGLTESTLEFLLLHPRAWKLSQEDIPELQRGLQGFQQAPIAMPNMIKM